MNKIDEYRIEKKLSYGDIAIKTGLTSVYIWSLAKGERTNPSKEAMDKIAKALNKSVAEVFYPDEGGI